MLLLFLLAVLNADLAAQSWQDTIGGYTWYVPDMSRPVRGVFLQGWGTNFFDDPQWRATCQALNLAMVNGENTGYNCTGGTGKGAEILSRLTAAAGVLNHPEIEFAGVILSGCSGGSLGAWFAVMEIPERVIFFLDVNQCSPNFNFVNCPASASNSQFNIPVFHISARFETNWPDANENWNSAVSDFSSGLPETMSINNSGHCGGGPQDFNALWGLETAKLRLPATAPSGAPLQLNSIRTGAYPGYWIGTCDFVVADSTSDSLRNPRIYAGNSPGTPGSAGEIWLPNERVAQAWVTWVAEAIMPIQINPPAPVSPANGDSNQALFVTCQWTPIAGALSYQFQLATDPSFSNLVIDQSGTSTACPVTGLINSTLYYWRVRATVTEGTTLWSDVWSFSTTYTPPSTPVLLAPADNGTGISRQAALSWNAVAGASTYHLQISKSSDFSTTVSDQSLIAGTSVSAQNLEYLTAYYWRVRAVNKAGTSAWSAVWSFTTGFGVPDVPVLLAPVNGAVMPPPGPDFTWETPVGAATYCFQLATHNSFRRNSLILDTCNVAQNSLPAGLPGLAENVYYWRVYSVNSAGAGAWSPIWSFTVSTTLPNVQAGSNAIPAPFFISPNPFNASTAVHYLLRSNQPVQMDVYHLSGKKVRTLAHGAGRPGYYSVVWNGRDEKGLPVGNGVYFIRFKTGEKTLLYRVMLSR